MNRFIYSILFIVSIPYMSLAQKKIVKVTSKTIHSSAGNAASINRGKTVYTAHCLACHQVDGSGVPNLNPPLIHTKWVMGSKAVLVQQVLKGSSNKVEIDGDHFHNVMPPLPTLSDVEIADVLTYIRNSFGNKYSSVSVAEVKNARSKIPK